MEFDLRTLYLTFSLTCLANVAVISYLWIANRKKYKGIGYLVVDFILQYFSMNLIFMRGKISDYLSISLGNTLSVAGIMLSLFGIQLLNQDKPKWYVNITILIFYAIIYVHFVSDGSSVEMRNFTYALFSNIYFLQILYLLLFRINKNYQKESKPIFFIILAFFIVNLFRIFYNGLSEKYSTDYFAMGGIESFSFIAYNVLFAMLTYGIVLNINNRLIYTLKKEEEKFYKAFNASPNAIVLSRLSDGLIYEINAGFENITGYNYTDCMGKTTLALQLWHNTNDRSDLKEELIKSNGLLVQKECQYRKKDGTLFYGKIQSVLITINGEDLILSTIEDITKMKVMINEIRITSDKLAKLNATKDKFFSIIAHDLRAPFTQVNALAELIKSDVAEKQYAEVDKEADLIFKSSQRAMGLLMNLLEWSRVQSGRIAFNPEQINLSKAINESILLLQENSKIKQISIHFSGDESLTCHADKNMFDSIIRNLLSNAIKFTHINGQININLTSQPNSIQVCVKDSGVGIEPTRAEKLFNIDGNQSTPGTLNEQGTGLGLVLCKEFVEKHGGKIWVTSKPEKGSTFCFSLPA